MARYTVTTPEKGHSGRVGAVTFVDGTAVIDDEHNPAELAYCRSAGYGIESADEEPAAEPEPDDTEMPKKSASTEVWRTWAAGPGGMDPERAEEMSRDALVEHYTREIS